MICHFLIADGIILNSYIKKCAEESKIHLDIILNKHCNLNCRGCSRFCGLTKPQFYDFNTLISDLKKISKIKEVINLTFSGGEPLVYPKDLLIDVLTLSRKLMPTVGFTIFTNGKNLLNADYDSVWECFHDNKINIVYSKYVKTNIDYDRIEEIGKILDVSVKNMNDISVNKNLNPTEITQFFLMKHTVKKYSTDKLEICPCNIPTLWDSKIFCCGDCIFLDTLNKRFGTNYDVKDYIHLDDLNIKTYKKLVKSPHDICGYCMNVKPEYIEWSQEKSTKEDYIE